MFQRNKLIHTARGLTFIELLVVTTILSIVSLAIYATFSNSIKIWQRVNTQLQEEDLNIFFDKLVIDLRNSFKFKGLAFLGEEDSLSFPTIVNSRRLAKTGVGLISYTYQPSKGILTKEIRDYSQIYEEEDILTVPLLKKVKSLKFAYYFFDADKDEYIWQDKWAKDVLPIAVRVELEFDEKGRTYNFTKTVNIPGSN